MGAFTCLLTCASTPRDCPIPIFRIEAVKPPVPEKTSTARSCDSSWLEALAAILAEKSSVQECDLLTLRPCENCKFESTPVGLLADLSNWDAAPLHD